MTIKALKDFAREMASLGLNTLVMEWEASYPFDKDATISNELAYTREEVTEFIGYCEKLGIDVIPLQQCFGHVEYIVKHDRYCNLREDEKEISQICPLKIKEDSILFTRLFTDLSSVHHSKYFHIGGDETYLLGHCPECSKKALAEGKSKLFVDYMKMICNIVISMGKTPVMWADILLKYPEAASELPPQTIFVDWNYGWKTNYFGNISALQSRGLEFWGAPAIRSHPDNYFVTCWGKHFSNQSEFIPYARKAGYTGIIMTSWSTSGVYGYTWDVGNEVIDMQQIRNTYPLSGFRILLAAYAHSLKDTTPLNPEKFVVNYAEERFGLSPAQGKVLWKALNVNPELIVNGKPATSRSIADMRDSLSLVSSQLYKITPEKNKTEFEHFKLMSRIREFYLAGKEIESVYNSDKFSILDKRALIRQVDSLLIESKKIDKKFMHLQKGFLYESEIRKQNEIRIQKLVILKNRLKGQRNLS
ncbi:MAG TPA: family 20 glycosylhydrolase [Bacteroidales bacterium]|nr:family 20 glycosylhydrolase [Bacteroidales bacterium]HPT20744.1 family 20 glycosylhydrolase [Bacteroidales bacterium]